MKRKPWMPKVVQQALKTEMLRVAGSGNVTTVLEYGGGGSTLWFLDHGCQVTTVEHNAQWARRIGRAAKGVPGSLLLLHHPRPYHRATFPLPANAWDIVIVDGRDRVKCTAEAIRVCKPGGLVVLDDSSRNKYAKAHARFQLAGFTSERFGIDKPTAPNGKRVADFYRKPVTQRETKTPLEFVLANLPPGEPCPHDTDGDGNCQHCHRDGGCPVE